MQAYTYKMMMKNIIKKYALNITIYIIIVCFAIIYIDYFTTYAYWYEEPDIYETENIENKWWLSRKQKENEKQKQKMELNKKIEENKLKTFKEKNIKWLYNDFDMTSFPKNKWEIIDDDGDGIGYNYYFDKNGYLLIDTITADYKIVDNKGREVDINQKPIKYQILINNNQEIVEETVKEDIDSKQSSSIIFSKGIEIKNKFELYDSSMNKNVNDYIEKSDRYLKETKGTIYNGIRWKNCSSLKGNGGYVIFKNPNNNFNKITLKISVQYSPYEDDNTYILKVYDQDEYDKYEEAHHFYDLYEIYEQEIHDKIDIFNMNIIFDRSIKRLRFELDTMDDNNSRTCYIKDLKYGFSKTAFAEELKRKNENEEEIKELKRLGIFVEDLWLLDRFDEEGENIYKEENDIDDEFIAGRLYTKDDFDTDNESISYEDIVRDRNTGPAFDEDLQNIKEVGPLQN